MKIIKLFIIFKFNLIINKIKNNNKEYKLTIIYF